MLFLFLAIVIGVIGEVFLFKIFNCAGKQIEKYDKKHSDFMCDSAEEFASKISSLADVQLLSVNPQSNTVNLICEKNEYKVKVEEGIAFVEYDTKGCGFKVSRVGRIFRVFKVCGVTKRAFVINAVLDRLLGKDDSDSKKEYKKLKNSTTAAALSTIVMIVFVIIGCIGLFGQTRNSAVSVVQAKKYYEDITYGTLINGYLVDENWSAFNTDTDTPVVEVSGVSPANEEIIVQFAGEMGMAFNLIENQEFYLRYFAINGQSVDPNEAMRYVYEYSMRTANNLYQTDGLVDQTVNENENRTLIGTYVQVGLYDHEEYAYLGEYVPTIYLYSDYTFEFDCNFFEYIHTYTGWWQLTEDTASKEYRFVVENEPDLPNLEFYIIQNKARCDADFYTEYTIGNTFGMTSIDYDNILFHSNFT